MNIRIKSAVAVLFSFLFVLIFALSACSDKEEDYAYTFNGNSNYNYMVNSINHRGFYTAPENTLAAYRESAINGFTMVECDVSFTKDGCPVLLHDDTVDRTSNGTGKIEDLTFEEVRAFDFGSWKSEKYQGEQIPSFEEFVALCRNLSLHPYIEIKFKISSEQVKTLIRTVAKYGMLDNVTWISSSKKCLRSVVEVDGNARMGLVVNVVTQEKINELLELAEEKENVFLNCNYEYVNSDAIALCVEYRIPLEVWTVDNEETILNLDPYISGVTSDRLVAGKVLYDYALQRR